MTIAYCPLDLDTTDSRPEVKVPQSNNVELIVEDEEEIKCDYIVLAFIIGVLFMIITDLNK